MRRPSHNMKSWNRQRSWLSGSISLFSPTPWMSLKKTLFYPNSLSVVELFWSYRLFSLWKRPYFVILIVSKFPFFYQCGNSANHYTLPWRKQQGGPSHQQICFATWRHSEYGRCSFVWSHCSHFYCAAQRIWLVWWKNYRHLVSVGNLLARRQSNTAFTWLVFLSNVLKSSAICIIILPHHLFLKEFLRGWQRPRHRSTKKLYSHVGATKPRRVQNVTRKTCGFLSPGPPNLVTTY